MHTISRLQITCTCIHGSKIIVFYSEIIELLFFFFFLYHGTLHSYSCHVKLLRVDFFVGNSLTENVLREQPGLFSSLFAYSHLPTSVQSCLLSSCAGLQSTSPKPRSVGYWESWELLCG